MERILRRANSTSKLRRRPQVRTQNSDDTVIECSISHGHLQKLYDAKCDEFDLINKLYTESSASLMKVTSKYDTLREEYYLITDELTELRGNLGAELDHNLQIEIQKGRLEKRLSESSVKPVLKASRTGIRRPLIQTVSKAVVRPVSKAVVRPVSNLMVRPVGKVVVRPVPRLALRRPSTTSVQSSTSIKSTNSTSMHIKRMEKAKAIQQRLVKKR
jgi:hypothetical protein